MEATHQGRSTRAILPADMGALMDMPYAQYAQADAINAHGLMAMLESPAAYQYSLKCSHEPTPSMMLGTWLDMALLEPERFAREIVCGDRRKIKPEDGQTVVTPAAYEKVQGMLAGVMANPVALELVEQQHRAQPTIFWHDAVHGVPCKARLDLVTNFGNRQVACDLKTAADASPKGFARAAANLNYDLQMAHYLAAGKATGLYSAELFFFIVVQNTAPYTCYVYQAGDSWFGRGAINRDHAMQLYAQCKAKNDWPSPPCFQMLELPPWARPIEEPESPAMPSDPPDIDLDQI